jgi:hypothetical protein
MFHVGWQTSEVYVLVLCGRLSIRPLNALPSAAAPEVGLPVSSDRPTYMRLDYQLLLRTTRPADADRQVRTLLAELEPSGVPASTRRPCRDWLADYNPLGQFGRAASRDPIR